MRFDEMAVFVRSAERHQPLLEEAFARAAIPAWYSRGVRRPEIGGRAFLALLREFLDVPDWGGQVDAVS
jgi:hypothetical protein